MKSLIPIFAAIAVLLCAMGNPLEADAGKKVVNQELILSDGTVALTAHAHPDHLPTYRAQVGADVSDSSDHVHFADVNASANQTDCDTYAPAAWGAWYTDLSTSEQGDVCDLVRGVGSYQVRVRFHLEATLTDETTGSITPSQFTSLVTAAGVSQAQFDAAASSHWPTLWSGLTTDEKATYRTLVLGLGW